MIQYPISADAIRNTSYPEGDYSGFRGNEIPRGVLRCRCDSCMSFSYSKVTVVVNSEDISDLKKTRAFFRAYVWVKI